MFYPTRAQMDPGSIWLRKLMLETGRELERGKRQGLRRVGKGAEPCPPLASSVTTVGTRACIGASRDPLA